MFLKKKINFIGLSILSLVLLLGLFTTAYASNYYLTDADITTILNTQNQGETKYSDYIARVQQRKNDLYNDYDTICISITKTNAYNVNVKLFGFNSSTVTKVNNLNNVNYMAIFTNTNGRYYSESFARANGSINESTNLTTYEQMGSGAQQTTNYLMYSNNLGTVAEGPWQSAELLNFGPVSSFDVNVVIGIPGGYNINYNGEMQDDIYLVDKYNYPSVYWDNGLYGLIDETTTDTLDMIVIDRMKYDYYTKQWSVYKQESYTTFSGEHFYYDGEYDVLVYLDNQIDDTLELVTVYPNDLIEASPVQYSFYWKSYQTQISSGDEISPDGTFSNNNYYDDYNNKIDNETQNTDTDKIIQNQNQNTQEIKDTLTDDSEVDQILLDTFSGDINTIANKTGFTVLSNPFLDIIEFLLYGICDTLLDDEEVVFSCTIHGINFVFDSREYITPLNGLTILSSTLLSSLFLFVFFKWGFHIYENMQDFNVSNLTEIGHNDDNWRYM